MTPPTMRHDGRSEMRWIPWVAGAFAALFLIALSLALWLGGEPGGGGRATGATAYEGLGGEFELTSHEGERIALSDFEGEVVVIYFGYAYCPDVCPVHLTLLGAALDQLSSRAQSQIQPLFITVDPARDTPEMLAEYVPHFSERLIGLTGTDEEIAAVAGDYAVGYERVEDPDFGGYLMNHSSIFYVINRQGQIVDLIRPDVTPAQMAATLRSHL